MIGVMWTGVVEDEGRVACNRRRFSYSTVNNGRWSKHAEVFPVDEEARGKSLFVTLRMTRAS